MSMCLSVCVLLTHQCVSDCVGVDVDAGVVCVCVCMDVCVVCGHAQTCSTPGNAAKSNLGVAFVYVSPMARLRNDHHESGWSCP